jgi:hypothetical protein
VPRTATLIKSFAHHDGVDDPGTSYSQEYLVISDWPQRETSEFRMRAGKREADNHGGKPKAASDQRPSELP